MFRSQKMLMQVHANGFELDSALRDAIREKVGASFDRFRWKVGRVQAYLADLNGPRNGIDKSMLLVVSLHREPKLCIQERGENWGVLLESVVDRATHNLTKKIKKSRRRAAGLGMAYTDEPN